MRLERESAGSNALFLTGVSAVSQVLGFGYRVILSRMVGAEVMGLYQLVMPVYSVLMSITATGLTTAVSNLSSRYLALDNSRAVRQTLRQAVTLFLLLFVPVAAVTLVLYDPISVCLLGDARTQLGLVLLLPCVLLTGIENFHKHFFYGTGQVRPPALTELTEQFIRTGSVLALLVLMLPQNPERTVGLIITGMVVCEIFSAVTQTVLYRRRMARIGLRGVGEKTDRLRRRMIAIAVPVSATALLGNLMSAVNAALIPQQLVAVGMDRTQAMSAFGVLCGMTMPMLALPTLFLGALNLVMVPRVARSCALGRMDQARDRIHRALETVAVLILPCMMLMTVVGPTLAQELFHEPAAGQYLVPLAAAMVCSCFQSILAGALSGVDRQGTSAFIAALCDVVQLAFTVFAMGQPGVGMAGFVAGMVVSGVLGLVLYTAAVHRYTGLRFRLWKLAGKPGLAAVLCWQTAALLFRVLRDSGANEWIQIGGTLIFGGVIYATALWAMTSGGEKEPKTGNFPADR